MDEWMILRILRLSIRACFAAHGVLWNMDAGMTLNGEETETNRDFDSSPCSVLAPCYSGGAECDCQAGGEVGEVSRPGGKMPPSPAFAGKLRPAGRQARRLPPQVMARIGWDMAEVVLR